MTTEVARAHTGVMAELNETGDTKVIWDKNNPDEVEAARATFDRLTKDRKFIAFSVKGKNGDKDERIRTFDPDAERIILVPQNVGG
jgi:hypothetical protein